MATDGANNVINVLLPGRVGLFVRLAARPGGRAALLDAMHRYTDELACEPSTEAIVIALDPDDVDIVWLLEWFGDEELFDAHRSTKAFAEMMAELPDLLASPPGLLRIDPLRLHLQSAVLHDGVGQG